MDEKRVIIVSPTRAVCETQIPLLEGEEFETRLMAAKGKEIIKLVRNKKRFGIVAVTGSGKSASIKRIIKEEFADGREFLVDIVTREHEATVKTWNSNVLVVTPGIALIWAKDGTIKAGDVIILDEIHQTSDHLELTEALILRIGCRVIWMSATVDAKVFARYLKSNKVIVFDKVDERKRAKVRIVSPQKEEMFLYSLIGRVIREKRGMVMFLPTRRETEEYAKATEEMFSGQIKVEFYHGGEPAAKLRPYLNRGIANQNRPFVIFMTNAGQSGLNIEGLNTIVVRDECFTEEIHGRTVVRVKTFLETNDLLQMIGRINGRVSGGEAYIITGRNINFHELRPQKVKFVLGRSLERLALVCGRLGIDLSELDLPEPIDRKKYADIVKKLIARGMFEPDGINLTRYGRRAERIPCSVEWAEMIVNCPPEILNVAIVCSSNSGLYRILKPDYDIDEFVVQGSDHLTAYNIVAHAITNYSRIESDKGYTQYRFREREFYEWAEKRGINAKEIEEIALALKSILHNLNMPIPARLEQADSGMRDNFTRMLAQVRSLRVVRKGRDVSDGNEIWLERLSYCDIEEIIFGTISAWIDKDEIIRRAVEGTEIPHEIFCRVK
ncbi:MAG: helicase-related protein [Candidatus Paceibacterota bacterium]|jgi:HrpA-like RNA helicase